MRMTFPLTLLLALSSTLAPAAAGPNKGGVLLLHAAPELDYTTSNRSYCDEFNVETFEDINVRGEPDPTRPQIFYILAAFDPAEHPRVKTIGFGISEDMDDERVVIEDWGICAGSIMEMPTANWPGPGTGTAVFFADTVFTQTIMPFYWFAAYVYGETEIALSKYPGKQLGGGFFVDDAQPPNEDPVAGFGILGFGKPGVKLRPRREGQEPELEVSMPRQTPADGDSTAHRATEN